MSVTDQYVENDVIYRVLENGAADANGTLATDMFAISDIIDAMNRIQQRFLLETGMIVTRAGPIVGTVGNTTYPLPADSIRPRRVTWTDSVAGTVSTLTQLDTWELDNAGAGDWTSAPANPPIGWYENNLAQQELGITPPSAGGSLNVLYIALAATLDGSGIPFTVPDDWTPYITWGVLGELLSSDGVAFDPLRAQYCSRRLDEGIELARLVLGGS